MVAERPRKYDQWFCEAVQGHSWCSCEERPASYPRILVCIEPTDQCGHRYGDENAANELTVKASDLKKLEKYTGLTGTKLSAFCKLLKLEGKHETLWEQRNILFQDVSQYLPDADVDAPTQLKELVTRKALSEAATNPTIERMDVLRALKTEEHQLYPAPCLIEQMTDAVPREQEAELFKAIVDAGSTPVIVHAEGGIGKSIFATRIKLGLPAACTTVLYDCFGNAQYRSATGYRHRHKNALVQIVNELAGKGLCHILDPDIKCWFVGLSQIYLSARTSRHPAPGDQYSSDPLCHRRCGRQRADGCRSRERRCASVYPRFVEGTSTRRRSARQLPNPRAIPARPAADRAQA